MKLSIMFCHKPSPRITDKKKFRNEINRAEIPYIRAFFPDFSNELAIIHDASWTKDATDVFLAHVFKEQSPDCSIEDCCMNCERCKRLYGFYLLKSKNLTEKRNQTFFRYLVSTQSFSSFIIL